MLTPCPCFPPRCPFQGDNYRTRLIPMGPASPELPFPSHYQRFVVSTFAFVEPPGMAVLEGEVRGSPCIPVLGIPHCWEPFSAGNRPQQHQPCPCWACWEAHAGFGVSLEARGPFRGVAQGSEPLFGDAQVRLALLWLAGVHLLQCLRVPPGPARALPTLLPAGSALT